MPKLKGKTYAYTKKGKEAYRKALMKKKKRKDAPALKSNIDKGEPHFKRTNQDQEFRNIERVRTAGGVGKDKKGREYPFKSSYVSKSGQPVTDGDAMLGRKKYGRKN